MSKIWVRHLNCKLGMRPPNAINGRRKYDHKNTRMSVTVLRVWTKPLSYNGHQIWPCRIRTGVKTCVSQSSILQQGEHYLCGSGLASDATLPALFFFTYIPRTRVQKIWTPLWFGDTATKNQNCFRNRQFSNVLYQDYWLLTVASHNESSIALNSGDGRKPLCTLGMLTSILTVILTSVLRESDSGGHGIPSVIWCVARIWAGSCFQASSSVTE